MEPKLSWFSLEILKLGSTRLESKLVTLVLSLVINLKTMDGLSLTRSVFLEEICLWDSATLTKQANLRLLEI